MNFNVSLDQKQIDEIANVTADKVLSTVKYHRGMENWYENEIKTLKEKIIKRDSLLVEKDLYSDRLYNRIVSLRNKLTGVNQAKPIKKWKEKYGNCLWWNSVDKKPLYCGTPLDSDFPHNVTHFTRLIVPHNINL